jgi:hypothetical protein
VRINKIYDKVRNEFEEVKAIMVMARKKLLVRFSFRESHSYRRWQIIITLVKILTKAITHIDNNKINYLMICLAV